MMILCQEQGDVSMTYKECQDFSIQIARYFQQQGYKKVQQYYLIILKNANCQGDVVALVMENRLEYTCYWLGLSYIGVIPALVNTNLRLKMLNQMLIC